MHSQIHHLTKWATFFDTHQRLPVFFFLLGQSGIIDNREISSYQLF